VELKTASARDKSPYGILALMSKLIIVMILSSLAAGQTQQAAEEQATRTAQATINWEQSSSPGMKAELVLVRKSETKGNLTVTYKVKVTGAPRDRRYAFVSWPITFPNPVTVMEGLEIDQTGTVVCPPRSPDSCAKNFNGAEIKLKYAPVKGEILRSALISKDQKWRIFFSTVPDPIIKKDAACSLELVRLSPGYALVLIRARGFLPGENVTLHTKSYDEVHDAGVRANAQGEFWAPLTPFVKDKNSGTTDVTTKGGKCAPALSFNWGSEQ
jgi:hypothetical protein